MLEAWIDRTEELSQEPYIEHIAPFENRGEEIGVTLSHPHGQIWADEQVPLFPARECERQTAYHAEKKSCLLCDYLALELKQKERIIFENDSFVALVPFWAVWPYETMLLPKAH